MEHYIKEIKEHLGGIHGNVPMHRRESKRNYTFSGLSFKEQLAIWDELWRTHNNFWLRLHAFFFLERHLKKETELLEMWPVIVHWQDQVDDWPLCDSLSKIYTKIMEVDAAVYQQLKSWNNSPNLWKRRQSIVSLLYYSRTKKKHLSFEEIEQQIRPLLIDKEYYVQKGVGWSLRELHTVYPVDTMPWLKEHIKLVSSIAFTIAIEKMDATAVHELKTLRKTK